MIPLNKDEIQSSKFYFLSDKDNLTRKQRNAIPAF